MKRKYTPISRLLTTFVILFVVSSLTLLGQTPTTFNYQAVLRDTDGNPMSNTSVSIELAIHQSTSTGTIVYSETHSTTTSEFGLVNLEMGSIDPVSFATIDWAAGPYFVEVSVDGTSMGTSELLTVPYALYAADADSLDGQNGSFYSNADNINAGTLDNARFSAYGNLSAEGRLDNNDDTDLLTRSQADGRYIPPHVAFYAYNSQNDAIATTGWVDVEFDTEKFDDGNNYDNTLDRFVAPVSGVYEFTAKVSVLDINAIGYLILGFSVNGGTNIKLQLYYTPTTDTHEIAHNGSFTYQLNAGDYVMISFYSSPDNNYTIYGNEYHTTFCGHLVYAY